jgi:type IV pilus assembly protein PilB
VASGKGGVGKTNIALNLALALQDKNRRICLLDGDLGLANIDVLLGISPPHSLIDFLEDGCSLEDVMIDGPGTLKIVPGGSSLDRLPSWNGSVATKVEGIYQYLQSFDELVIDSAAGISELVLHFMDAATVPIVVVVPEPTSLTDAYSLLKTYQKRKQQATVYVLVNKVKTPRQAQVVFQKLKSAVDQYLQITLKALGYVASDDQVRNAVAMQRPFIEMFPDSPASLDLKRIARFVNQEELTRPGDLENLLFTKDAQSSEKSSPAEEAAISPCADLSPVERASEKPSDSIIVQLLVKEGYISASQLSYAIKVQEKLETPRRLLEVVKDLGYVREPQVQDTLRKNRTGLPLGSLLVELGHITETQLATALNRQKLSTDRKRLGEVLVDSGFITAYELTRSLSINLGIPYVELGLEALDRSLMEKANKQFYLTHALLPLGSESGSVKIAMADPLNRSALEAAQKTYGPKLIIAIAQEQNIKDTIEAYDSMATKGRKIEGGTGEAVDLVDRFIQEALSKCVSDIHVEPLKNRIRIRFRKDGVLTHYTDVGKDIGPSLVNRIKVMASANITEKRRHQDGRILVHSKQSGEEVDIRASFYVTIFGEKIVMRILSKKAELYKIDDVGMGPKMLNRFKEEVLDLPSGVIIITGPTGAGKTTTLYASINYCNQPDTNIITAEEPVEYVIEGISQCSIDPKIGLTFEETLRHMLRQDPDIMILGEIRDRFSAESAIQAALTGHKVLTTFHTEDSIGGLLRLMNMDIETFLISSTIVSVVAQRLLKKVCPNCRKPYVPNARDLRRLRYQTHDISGHHFFMGSGCSYCDFTGYKGRVGVFEMLVLNEYVKEALLKKRTSYEIRRTSIDTTGLVTLFEDGIAKAAKGITSLSEVIRHLPLLETPRPVEQIYRLVGELG